MAAMPRVARHASAELFRSKPWIFVNHERVLNIALTLIREPLD